MEVTLKNEDIKMVVGDIEFPQKEELINQAQKVADYVNSLTITEENQKIAKKKLAEVKKLIKQLDDERKRIKKEYTLPLTKFENDFKEIKAIIDEAEQEQRKKLKAFDEAEKEMKYQKIEKMFLEQVSAYGLENILNIDHFFKNEMLNKSYSMKKIEEELCLWLEKTADDLYLIDNFEYAEEIKLEYLGMCKGNIRLAKETVESRHKQIEKLKTNDIPDDEYITIKIKKSDLDKVACKYEVIG